MKKLAFIWGKLMNLLYSLFGVVWNNVFEDEPAGGDSPSYGDDEIRNLKEAVRERFEKEHKMDLTSGTAAGDGAHKQGSTKVYIQATTPTLRPDGITPLSVNDNGRFWIHSTTYRVKVYQHPNWVELTAQLGTDNVWSGTQEYNNTSEFNAASEFNAVAEFIGNVICQANSPFSRSTVLTSGSGNWTVPADVHRVRAVVMGAGGGGGGVGGATGLGTAGGSTTFNGLTALGGVRGNSGYPGTNRPGAAGQSQSFGPEGGQGAYYYSGSTYVGSGGKGGSGQVQIQTFSVTPAADLAYSVGVGGTGGAADGSSKGGNGAPGMIILYY